MEVWVVFVVSMARMIAMTQKHSENRWMHLWVILLVAIYFKSFIFVAIIRALPSLPPLATVRGENMQRWRLVKIYSRNEIMGCEIETLLMLLCISISHVHRLNARNGEMTGSPTRVSRSITS